MLVTAIILISTLSGCSAQTISVSQDARGATLFELDGAANPASARASVDIAPNENMIVESDLESGKVSLRFQDDSHIPIGITLEAGEKISPRALKLVSGTVSVEATANGAKGTVSVYSGTLPSRSTSARNAKDTNTDPNQPDSNLDEQYEFVGRG